MTVASTINRNDYVGSGTTGPFGFTFRVLAAADLTVIQRSAAGIETTLAYLTDYTLSAGAVGSRTGGSVTLTVAVPADGSTLTIKRAVALLQPTELRNQGAYYPEAIEDALDRLVMIDQTQGDAIARSLQLLPSLTPAGKTLTLNPAVAGQAIVADGAGGFTMAAISAGAVALPGNGRTVTSLSAYLAHNASFHVLDYGADPTGVADSTSAIQTAISLAWAVGGIVDFGPGIFNFTSLSLPTPQLVSGNVYQWYSLTMRGAGASNVSQGFGAQNLTGTILKCTGTGDAIAAISTHYGEPTYTFLGLTLIGPDTVSPRTTTSGNGIRISGTAAPRVIMRDVVVNQFYGAGKAGIWLDDPEYNVLDTVVVSNCDIGLKLTSFVTASVFNSVKLQLCASYGGYFVDAYSNTWNALTIQSNEKTGLYGEGLTHSTFNSTHFENNNTSATASTYALDLRGSATRSVVGLKFTSSVFNNTRDKIYLAGYDAGHPVSGVHFENGQGNAVSGPLITIGTDFVSGIDIDDFCGLSRISCSAVVLAQLNVRNFGLLETALKFSDGAGNAKKYLDFSRVTMVTATSVPSHRGNAFLFVAHNAATGESVTGLYTNSYGVTLIAQSAASFVTGAPAAGQIQIQNDAGLGIAFKADAARNGNIVHCTLLGTVASA